MQRTILLAAALIAGISFYFVRNTLEWPVMVAWKGAGVTLLAVWAASEARNRAGWLLVAALAFCALGDVLLETSGLIVGAIAFLTGHILALVLYLGAPRIRLGKSVTVAIGVALGIAGLAFILTREAGVALYSLGLGAMAGAALTSRFDRRWVGLGAVLFIISDLLIFASFGILNGSALPGLLIWPTYFGGQALIAIGVVRRLRAPRDIITAT